MISPTGKQMLFLEIILWEKIICAYRFFTSGFKLAQQNSYSHFSHVLSWDISCIRFLAVCLQCRHCTSQTQIFLQIFISYSRFLALGLNQPNTAHQTCRAPGNGRGSCRHLHHCLQVLFWSMFLCFGKIFCVDGLESLWRENVLNPIFWPKQSI